VALGVLDTLRAKVEKVGVFRPVSRSRTEPDYVLQMLLAHDGVDLEYDDCVGVTYDDVHADPDAALGIIVEKFRAVAARCQAMVIVGSDYTDVGNPTEFGFNAKVAANLGAPVALVVTGREPSLSAGRDLALPARSVADVVRVTQSALSEIRHAHASVLAVMVNRASQVDSADLLDQVGELDSSLYVATIPEDTFLVAPTVRSVMAAIAGTLLHGDDELLEREALGVMVAAMSLESIIQRLREGFVVLVPGDRSDAIVGVLMAHRSENFPSLAALILYGGFPLSPQVRLLIEGVDDRLPIIHTLFDTYESVLHVVSARGRLAADSQRKFDTALQLFHDNVDEDALLERMNVTASSATTPLMFQYTLLERARKNKKHIVLPEGSDDRIIRASATLLARNVVDITLLGDEGPIRQSPRAGAGYFCCHGRVAP